MVFDYVRIDGWFVSEGDRVTGILLYFGEQCMHRERANVVDEAYPARAMCNPWGWMPDAR